MKKLSSDEQRRIKNVMLKSIKRLRRAGELDKAEARRRKKLVKKLDINEYMKNRESGKE